MGVSWLRVLVLSRMCCQIKPCTYQRTRTNLEHLPIESQENCFLQQLVSAVFKPMLSSAFLNLRSSQSHSAPLHAGSKLQEGFLRFWSAVSAEFKAPGRITNSRRAICDGHGLEKRQSIKRNRQFFNGEIECTSWSPPFLGL